MCLSGNINNYIYPFGTSPTFSNYGTLGLIQNPNARFAESGTLGLTWSHHDPYLRGSVMAYPFSWLEASFQYTDINNRLYSEVKEFSGNQSLKDKSFDAKFLLHKESNFLPQIAAGIRDIGGTGLFASEYLVLSKRLADNLDFTIGLGWGNLNGNKISNPLTRISRRFDVRDSDQGLGGKVNFGDFFSGDSGYFGGIEYIIPKWNGARIKLEIDGTNYVTESGKPINQDSNINIGIVYPVNKRLKTKLSFTRGNTINFGFSYVLNLSKKNPLNVNKSKKTTLRNSQAIKEVTAKSESNLYRATLLYLRDERISLQKASLNDNEYHVVVSQALYRSPGLAIGRALNIVDQIAPASVEDIKISEVNAGMGMYSIKVPREVLSRYRKFSNTKALDRYVESEGFLFDEENYKFNPKVSYPVAFNTIGPELISQIGGPDGFFFGDLKLNLDSEIKFSRNFTVLSSLSYGLIDNMDELKLGSDSILPHVRTDIVKYLKQSRNFSIKRLQFNYYDQFSNSLFYRLSGGILESMFSGFGGEILYRPYDKNYGIGIDAWEVYQREYNQMFGLQEYRTLTGHLSFYFQEPKTNILFILKGGKYLAKDSGITFDVSRIFRSGLRMGAFFSLTDISEEEFGEGSFDKGFYFWVPVELFSGRHFKRTFGWGLRPITRDGAQSLIYAYPLWGVTDTSNNHRFRRRIDEIFD